MHITEPRRRLECRSRSALHAACLFAVLAALGGCGGGTGGGSAGGSAGGNGGTGGIACTAGLRASVLLTVVDQANVTLPGVSVSYQVNGGPSQNQPCESGVCTVGYGVAGTFSITAAKIGYSPASGTVTVTQGECEVNTESLTLRLVSTP
jgi:hypothetical protein